MGLTTSGLPSPQPSPKGRGSSFSLGEKVRMRAVFKLILEFLQIASPFLLFLKRLKQGFEIAFAETFRALALDDFEEERRAIFHRFGKYLQQIPLVVAIDQNAESL